jgi:hypothetical protein
MKSVYALLVWLVCAWAQMPDDQVHQLLWPGDSLQEYGMFVEERARITT